MSRVKQLVLQAAQEANILPLTSACNVNCIFCSNRQNPPGVEVFPLPPLTMEEVREAASFLDSGKKIVIGESITRICEGEPFTHPQIKEILLYLREKFPSVMLQITTNGTFLDSATVSFLKSVGQQKTPATLEIILSLNSADAGRRFALMQDSRAATAVKSAVLLGREGIPFHGSLVAMPAVTGWRDIEDTISYLADNGAQTVRVFLPGFTRLAPPELKFDLSLWGELQDFIEKCRAKINIPLLCEPTFLDNLDPEILGVIPGSPADTAGLAKGEVITAIDGRPVFSRVDAFNQLRAKGDGIEVEILGLGAKCEIKVLTKKPGETSGVVMACDLAPETAGDIDQIIRRQGAWTTLILASQPGAGLLKLVLEKAGVMSEWHVIPAPSRFFGGSIIAAGLLVVEDFLYAAGQFLASAPSKPQLIIVPAVAFDLWGRDLTGRSYLEIEQETGIKTELV